MIDAMTADSKRTIRVPLLLTPKEAKNLDDWQFANRLRTRSDAIRRLIEIGLGAATHGKFHYEDTTGLTVLPPEEDE